MRCLSIVTCSVPRVYGGVDKGRQSQNRQIEMPISHTLQYDKCIAIITWAVSQYIHRKLSHPCVSYLAVAWVFSAIPSPPLHTIQWLLFHPLPHWNFSLATERLPVHAINILSFLKYQSKWGYKLSIIKQNIEWNHVENRYAMIWNVRAHD